MQVQNIKVTGVEGDGHPTSSFIRRITWQNDGGEKGNIIIKIENDNGVDMYRYEGVRKELFNDLEMAAKSGRSLGKTYNRLLKNDSSLEAKKREAPEA